MLDPREWRKLLYFNREAQTAAFKLAQDLILYDVAKMAAPMIRQYPEQDGVADTVKYRLMLNQANL